MGRNRTGEVARAIDVSQDFKRRLLHPLNHSPLGAIQMLDVLMIALALVFFALSVGYTVACDRL
jgi:hypothetical protein